MAYVIDDSAKQSFLQEIYKPGFVLDGMEFPSPEDLQNIADLYHLAPSFTALLESIADGDKDFMAQAITALRPGYDTAKAPSRWLIAMWPVVSDMIEDPELKKAATDVVDLHRRVLEGVVVARLKWRQARRAFGEIGEDVSGAAADVFAAGAWDPFVAGQSISDSISALHALGNRQWEVQTAWSPEEVAQCNRDEAAATEHGQAAAGEVPGAETPQSEVEAWIERYQAAYADYCKTHCPRVQERQDGLEHIRNTWNGYARRALIDACAVV